MKPIVRGERHKLKRLLGKQVSLCGRMYRARKISRWSYEVLLCPVEIAGKKFDDAWVLIPHLCIRLIIIHVLSLFGNFKEIKKLLKGKTIEFKKFYALSGKAYVESYLKEKNLCYTTNYGVRKVNSLTIKKKDEYIKEITDKVAKRIAKEDHLPFETARQKFVSSKFFSILTSSKNLKAGLGSKTIFNLYQRQSNIAEQITQKQKNKLKTIIYNPVSYYGRIVKAQRTAGQGYPFPYQILLSPVELNGIILDGIWLNVQHLPSHLRKQVGFSRAKQQILKENRPLKFNDFYALSGKAYIQRCSRLTQKIHHIKFYVIVNASPFIVDHKNMYIKKITDLVTEKIAKEEHLPPNKARQKFLLSNAFNTLSSLDELVAGLGPDIYLELYQKHLVKAA